MKQETDQSSADRLKKLEDELADTEEKADALTARWQAEKQKLGHAADLKKRLDEARNELAIAQRNGQFQRAGGDLWHHSGSRKGTGCGGSPR